MLKVKSDQFHVSWDNIMKLWRVAKIGKEDTDYLFCPQLRGVTGESITYYNSDGSMKVRIVS